VRIVTQQEEGSVLCIMSNGDLIEITMLETEGEEHLMKSDVQGAIELLAKHKNLLKLWTSHSNK
jgi:hypothetical protein